MHKYYFILPIVGAMVVSFVRLFGHVRILILASQEDDFNPLKVGFYTLSSQKHRVWLHRTMFLKRKVMVVDLQTPCFWQSIAWSLLPTENARYIQCVDGELYTKFAYLPPTYWLLANTRVLRAHVNIFDTFTPPFSGVLHLRLRRKMIFLGTDENLLQKFVLEGGCDHCGRALTANS